MILPALAGARISAKAKSIVDKHSTLATQEIASLEMTVRSLRNRTIDDLKKESREIEDENSPEYSSISVEINKLELVKKGRESETTEPSYPKFLPKKSAAILEGFFQKKEDARKASTNKISRLNDFAISALKKGGDPVGEIESAIAEIQKNSAPILPDEQVGGAITSLKDVADNYPFMEGMRFVKFTVVSGSIIRVVSEAGKYFVKFKANSGTGTATLEVVNYIDGESFTYHRPQDKDGEGMTVIVTHWGRTEPYANHKFPLGDDGLLVKMEFLNPD